jgi:hypothetical protein
MIIEDDYPDILNKIYMYVPTYTYISILQIYSEMKVTQK